VLISVVIPTLEEAEALPATLSAVLAQEPPFEIVVADGSSGDATCEIAQANGACVVEAPRGRAAQMNAGARAASGDVLLFLHADTLLPLGGLRAVREALAPQRRDPKRVAGGCFRLRFDRRGPLLRAYGACTRLPWPAVTFGDRAYFARRDAFEAVGGFPSVPVFEDLLFFEALSRWSRREGARLAYLPERVVTSARRFDEHGAARQQLRNAALWFAFKSGVPPERLARWYPAR
jgi:rSAM/selenodomain-associated transferase 2